MWHPIVRRIGPPLTNSADSVTPQTKDEDDALRRTSVTCSHDLWWQCVTIFVVICCSEFTSFDTLYTRKLANPHTAIDSNVFIVGRNRTVYSETQKRFIVIADDKSHTHIGFCRRYLPSVLKSFRHDPHPSSG